MKRFDEGNGKVWETAVHYGGTRLSPKLSCTCPLKDYRCDHKQALLDEMRSTDWLMIENGWGAKKH